MNLNEFQEKALKSAIYPDSGKIGGLVYATLGLAGEAGELANKVKKLLRDDGIKQNQSLDLSPDKHLALMSELGDCAWYISAVAKELGVTLEDVAKMNLDKLHLRSLKNKLKGEGDAR